MTQHKGDLFVSAEVTTNGQVTGTTYVQSGGLLICHGQLCGGLIIEPGGEAVIYGQVARNVINQGRLTLMGQVCGRVIGNPPTNSVGSKQIIGDDLETPLRGTSTSYTIDY